MSHAAIEVEGLSKRYQLGAKRERYSTLRGALVRASSAPSRVARRVWQASRGVPRTRAEEFWALSDVSFTVAPGEVIGVIGRNGAGKSTLLKLLARITEPTRGHALIAGRVGSLLEVGTGFHLELTGRENIYLNGSILGMKRFEIDRKFDEIVAFAEVERFIDTPVKHYSSGMHLRLAFAVAAHLEPEILLVDEVLAVGDAVFQQKCLGKMGDVAAQGRTVLFVSHNLGAVRELCHSSLVLKQGRVIYRGSLSNGLAAYSDSLREDGAAPRGRMGWRDVTINGQVPGHTVVITPDQGFVGEARLELDADVEAGRVFCILEDGTGHTLMHQRVDLDELRPAATDSRVLGLSVHVPVMWLSPGIYTLYFKLIGHRSNGADVRRRSERALLEIDGTVGALGKALLAPRVVWDVESLSIQTAPRC